MQSEKGSEELIEGLSGMGKVVDVECGSPRSRDEMVRARAALATEGRRRAVLVRCGVMRMIGTPSTSTTTRCWLDHAQRATISQNVSRRTRRRDSCNEVLSRIASAASGKGVRSGPRLLGKRSKIGSRSKRSGGVTARSLDEESESSRALTGREERESCAATSRQRSRCRGNPRMPRGSLRARRGQPRELTASARRTERYPEPGNGAKRAVAPATASGSDA